jgi:hypothetical protein
MVSSLLILKALIRSLLDTSGSVDVDFVEKHFLPELKKQGYAITKTRAKCKK